MHTIMGQDKVILWVDIDNNEVNVKQIKDAIAGLKLLRLEVSQICLPSVCFCDMDTSYYRRFPEEVTDEIWRRFNGKPRHPFVTLKGNRLYMEVCGREVVLPKDLKDLHKDQLTVWLYLNREED